jgi:hypothetical protein
LCDAGIKTKLEEKVSTGYCQNSVWGCPGIAIYIAEFDYISIMNLVMQNKMNVDMILIVLFDYGSCQVIRDAFSLSVYSELCHHSIHLVCESFGEVHMCGAIIFNIYGACT